MPNKNQCNVCGKRHFYPYREKCKYAKKMEKSAKKDASIMPQSGDPVSSDGNSSDFNILPQGGVPAVHSINKKSQVKPHNGVPAHKTKKGAVKPLVT